MMAVSGGMLASLCFLESFARKELRLISLDWCPSLTDSKSSISALATSAQHRKNRSLSGARSVPFFFDEAVAVTVAVTVAIMSLPPPLYHQ